MTTPTLLLTLVFSSLSPADPLPPSPDGHAPGVPTAEARAQALAGDLAEMAALWRDQASSRNSTTSSARGGPSRR